MIIFAKPLQEVFFFFIRSLNSIFVEIIVVVELDLIFEIDLFMQSFRMILIIILKLLELRIY
jgi:hypothetical protein